MKVVKTERNTKHKSKLLELFSERHILSGVEVCQLVPTMHKSTVYRNLQKFVDQGVLKEVHIESDVVHYELAEHDHHHFVCEECEDIQSFEIDPQKIKSLLPEGLEAKQVEISVKGVCGECE